MHAFNRTMGPIGSSALASIQTSSGMLVTNQKPMPGHELLDFKGHFRTDNFRQGAVIYRREEANQRVYLLKAGRVRLMRNGHHGPQAVVNLLRAGDVFGDLFRNDGEASEEVAVAAGDVEVWSMDSRDFISQLEARPSLALEVIRVLADRVQSLQRRVHGLTFKEVPARLADILLALCESHGEACPHGGETDLRGITQQDLADLVGASRSFVSTLINEMKRDGTLGNVGRTLCVRDLKALRSSASEEK